MSNDAETTIQELVAEVYRFNDERDWHQFHTPKNVAASIVIEAAELLEHFQWAEEPAPEQVPEVAAELADVVIYCLVLAERLGVDVSRAVREKLARNENRYPAETYRGRF